MIKSDKLMKSIKFWATVLTSACVYKVLAKKEVRKYLGSSILKGGKRLFLKPTNLFR
jgi:hypothetical protein